MYHAGASGAGVVSLRVVPPGDVGAQGAEAVTGVPRGSAGPAAARRRDTPGEERLGLGTSEPGGVPRRHHGPVTRATLHPAPHHPAAPHLLPAGRV